MEVVETPSKEDIDSVNLPSKEAFLKSLTPAKPKILRDMFPTASEDALSLLKNLLHFNPNKRFTAE